MKGGFNYFLFNYVLFVYHIAIHYFYQVKLIKGNDDGY